MAKKRNSKSSRGQRHASQLQTIGAETISFEEYWKEFLNFARSGEVAKLLNDPTAIFTEQDAINNLAIIRKESGFKSTAKNPTSSARGFQQFIDSTYEDLRRRFPVIEADNKNCPVAGVLHYMENKQQMLGYINASESFKQDLREQSPAYAAKKKELGDIVQPATDRQPDAMPIRREPTPGETYSAHFLGTATARKILHHSVPGNMPIGYLVEAGVPVANKGVALRGKRLTQFTVNDFMKWTDRSTDVIPLAAVDTPPKPETATAADIEAAKKNWIGYAKSMIGEKAISPSLEAQIDISPTGGAAGAKAFMKVATQVAKVEARIAREKRMQERQKEQQQTPPATLVASSSLSDLDLSQQLPEAQLKRGDEGKYVRLMQEALARVGAMDDRPRLAAPPAPVEDKTEPEPRTADAPPLPYVEKNVPPAPVPPILSRGKANAPDGDFGPATERALTSYQKREGLKPTGIFDKATRDTLREALKTRDKVQNKSREGAWLNLASLQEEVRSAASVLQSAEVRTDRSSQEQMPHAPLQAVALNTRDEQRAVA